ncbi:MAG: hypothetical protein JWR63_958 [Conexibacter sp.]|nr:hypothetical protein [Conexibacter sp.]
MQTRSKPQPTSRIGRRPAPAPQGRFGRPGKPGRRKPQQSTGQKALASLTGALSKPSAAKKRSGGPGKSRAGRMALLAGGLGLAMKNRGRIQGLMARRSSDKAAAEAAAPAPAPTPTTTPTPGL